MSRTERKGMNASGIRICLLLLFAFSFCLLFPAKAKAEIIRQSSGNSLTLTGVNEVILESDGAAGRLFTYDYELPLKGTVELSLDYTVNFSISFPSLDVTPDEIKLSGLQSEFLFTKRLSPSFSGTIEHTNYSGTERVHLSLSYDEDMTEQLPITYQFKLELLHKEKPVSMKFYEGYGMDALYPNQTTSFSMDINDPNVSSVDASLMKVTSSNTSVLKVVSKSKEEMISTTMVDVKLKALKTGSSTVTVTYKDQVYKFNVKVKKPYAKVFPTSDTVSVGTRVSIYNYIYSVGSLSLKNIRSSKPSVVSVSGKDLRARKPGTAIIRFKLNGKNKKLRIAVIKEDRPTLKHLNVQFLNYDWYTKNNKCNFTIKLSNTSTKTITRATFRFSGNYGKKFSKTRTVNVNLKSGQSKIMTVYVQKMSTFPRTNSCKVTCTQFWYR